MPFDIMGYSFSLTVKLHIVIFQTDSCTIRLLNLWLLVVLFDAVIPAEMTATKGAINSQSVHEGLQTSSVV